MKKTIAGLWIVALVGLTSCGGNKVETLPVEDIVETPVEETQREVSLTTVVGEIMEIRDGTDGSEVVIKDSEGNTYTSIISIPNLGPASEFDFADIQLGNTLKLTGETFSLGEELRLTPSHAELVK